LDLASDASGGAARCCRLISQKRPQPSCSSRLCKRCAAVEEEEEAAAAMPRDTASGDADAWSPVAS